MGIIKELYHKTDVRLNKIVFKAPAEWLAFKCSVNVNKKLKFMTVFDK